MDRWDDLLATMAGLFASQKSQISYYTSFEDISPFFRFFGFSRQDIEGNFLKYREFSLNDPRTPPRLFKAYHCRQLVTDEALHASELYRQVLAPTQVEYAMYFGLDLGEDGKCAIGIMRGPDHSPFTDEECDDFGRFIPHVSRAVTMHGTLRRAHDALAAAHALIDSIPLAMMVVDDDRIVMTNLAARALLDEEDPLRRAGLQLRATSAEANAKLGQAMREARGGHDQPVGVTLPASNAEQVRAVVRQLRPEAARMLGASDGALAFYLADSRRPVETSEELLRRMFGLTVREAAVLQALVRGDDTRGIAERLKIGVETVKTHLRHVMLAVGVRRQTDLIRLVLSTPAWLGAEAPAPVGPGSLPS